MENNRHFGRWYICINFTLCMPTCNRNLMRRFVRLKASPVHKFSWNLVSSCVFANSNPSKLYLWIYLLLQNLKLKVTKYINFRLTMWYAISDLHIFGTYNCFPRNLADNLISGSFYLPDLESVSQLWVLLTIYFWKDRINILKFATDFYPYIKL